MRKAHKSSLVKPGQFSCICDIFHYNAIFILLNYCYVDLHALFLAYNDKFFWGRLVSCEVSTKDYLAREITVV